MTPITPAGAASVRLFCPVRDGGIAIGGSRLRAASATVDALRLAGIAGAGAGLRSMAPLAVLAARGRGPFPGPARFIAYGAAAGELVADTQPDMGSRWAARGLSLRVSGAVIVGADRGGAPGAVVAVAAALASARVGSLIRGRLAEGGLLVAVAEDALSYALLAAGTAGTD